MWLRNDLIQAVDGLCKIRYIDMTEAARWNAQREPGEPRMFTGWCWYGKGRQQQGLKTMSAAYRDAWYVLVKAQAAPPVSRAMLRVVKGAA